MSKLINLLVAFLIATVVVFSTSAFIVSETEIVIKQKFGEVIKTDYKPGLHFLIPFVNTIKRLDKRVLTYDDQPEEYQTGEKKKVVVNSFVKWRIADAKAFYKATLGSERIAEARLGQIVSDQLRAQFGKRSFDEVVTTDRSEVMDVVLEKANEQVSKLGILLVDVRIKQVELPTDARQSAIERMKKDLDKLSREHRAQGQEASEKIKADANRQRTELLAEAYKESQMIRGKGDAVAAKTYADAYNADREFYAFHRSLEAYRKSFADNNGTIVVEPDSEFFRYFKSMTAN